MGKQKSKSSKLRRGIDSVRLKRENRLNNIQTDTKNVKCPMCQINLNVPASLNMRRVLSGHKAWCTGRKNVSQMDIPVSSYEESSINAMDNDSESDEIRSNIEHNFSECEERESISDLGDQNGSQFSNENSAPDSYVPDAVASQSLFNHEKFDHINLSASLEYYKYQKKLLNSYSESITICKNSSGRQPSAQTTMCLYDLKVRMNLSNNQGDQILNCFNAIVKNSNCDLPLPQNFRTLNRQCSEGIIDNLDENDKTESLFKLKKFKLCLDNTVFGELTKSTIGYGFDIMQILSEILLNVQNPQNFICNPDRRLTNSVNPQPILEEYTTGDHFMKLTEAVRETSGVNNAVALCFGITLDATTSYSGKRTETPVCIYVLNLIDESFEMNLLGYAPSKLPYTDVELRSSLSKKRKAVVVQKLITMADRRLKLDYLFELISPIVKYQKNGLIMRVGKNENAFDITAFPHLVMITGDSQELDYIAGTSHRSSTMKCRICTETDCISFIKNRPPAPFRKDVEMQNIGLICQNALKSHYYNGASEQTTQAEELKRNYNMKVGFNPLISLFSWQNKRGINSFFEAVVPDYLHTVIKGIIEYAVTWSINCIHAFEYLDEVSFRDSMLTIDQRIKYFPVVQSMEFSRRFRFTQGISHLVKNTWKVENKGTGHMAAGNNEAWKMLSLIFQLPFCINKDICPFSKDWSKKHKLNHSWIPGQVIVNALTAAQELHFCCSALVMTLSGVDSLRTIISNARAQISMLWVMRSDLTSTCSRTNKPNKPIQNASNVEELTGFFEGIKLHLISHIPYYKLKFGADKRTMDTELSERYHKYCVKELFENTNKQYELLQANMLMTIRKKIYNEKINNTSSARNRATLSTANDGFTNSIDASSISGVAFYNTVVQNGVNHLVLRKNINGLIAVYTVEKINFATEPERYILDATAINKTITSFSAVIELANNVSNAEHEKYEASFCYYWTKFKSNHTKLRFSKCIRCSKSLNIDSKNDFKVYCDNSYLVNKKKTKTDGSRAEGTSVVSVCSFVEVRFAINDSDYDTALAHIVAIFSFVDDTTSTMSEHVFIMLCWMETDKKATYNMLPYPKYKYSLNSDRKNLYMSIVPIDHIYRPAYCIPHSDKGFTWNNIVMKNIQTLGDYRFYSIPYEQAKRDSCDDFVTYSQRNHNGFIDSTMKAVSDFQSGVRESLSISQNTTDYLSDSLTNVPMMLNEDQIIGIEKFINKFYHKLNQFDDNENHYEQEQL